MIRRFQSVALCTFGAVVLLAGASLAVARAQSAQSAPQVGRLEGSIVDGTSGAPLSGALVAWTSGKQVMHGTTNASGHYAFSVPVPICTSNLGTTVLVQVDANRYEAAEKAGFMCPGQTVQLNFKLDRLASSQIAVVSGKVTNAKTGKGIAGATVSIFGAGGVLQAVSGEGGSYKIPGVGFHSGLTIRMSTTAGSDLDTSTPPCLTPVQRTFDVLKPIVSQNFVSSPAMKHAPDCAVNVELPPGIVTTPKTTTDDSIQWEQADSFSIFTDPTVNAWNSGHINDILKLGNNAGFLVAADSGGVWAISSEQHALPLSDGWDSVNINSLAFGPEGGVDVFAGTWASAGSPGGVLWETDTSALLPLLNWSQVTPQPPCATGSSAAIQKILVIPQASRIVVACNNGLFWSPIPAPPSVRGTYNWSQAILGANVPALPSNTFSGLAQGPGWNTIGPPVGTIVAALWDGSAPEQMIYIGRWQSGNLVLTPGAVETTTLGTPQPFGRASVASCPSNPNIVYAMAADGDDQFLGGVWRSTNGGANWSLVSTPDQAGNQGFWNQAIAVSPADCNTVAVEFRHTQPFISFDGANSYEILDDGLPDEGGNEHSDHHAVLFDPDTPTTIYFGSDGGMLGVSNVSSGSTPAYQSDFNQEVLDLQLYHAAASSHSSGLVASALQDNGTDAADLDAFGFWAGQAGSDGVNVDFATPDSLASGNDFLLRTENCCQGSQWAAEDWNGNMFGSGNVIPVANPGTPPDSDGVAGGPIGRVRVPAYRNKASQLMYAVAGLGQSVYGLFADDDGGDMHWETLGEVGPPDNVTSVSSFNGDAVFVGTDHYHIYELNAPFTATATSLAISSSAGSPGTITSIVEFTPSIGFAALSINSEGFVLGWQGEQWQALGGGTLTNALPFNAVALPDLGSLFAISAKSVFVSHDLGTTWLTANSGLPSVPQGTDLTVVTQPNGTSYLYMASYGRSLWRALLP